jgi:hypothetical protein
MVVCAVVNSMQNLMPTLSRTSAKRRVTCPKYKWYTDDAMLIEKLSCSSLVVLVD